MSIPPPPAPQSTPGSESTFHADRLGVGETISDSFSIFFRNLPVLAVLALIFNLPSFALRFFAYDDFTQAESGPFGFFFIGSILSLLLTFVLTGAVIKGIYEQMCGRPLRLGDCLGVAIARFVPLVAAAILTTVAITLGFVLLIIPGLIVMMMFYVVTAVVVVEGEGPFEAMSRSLELTKGHRWSVFWISVVLGIIDGLITGVAGMILKLFLMGGDPLVGQLLTDILTAIVSVIPAVVTGVVYYRLRQIKEGVGLEDLATVFA